MLYVVQFASQWSWIYSMIQLTEINWWAGNRWYTPRERWIHTRVVSLIEILTICAVASWATWDFAYCTYVLTPTAYGQKACFDIRVFYPLASSYCQKDLAFLYHRHESEKKREYVQWVRVVECGALTPLVFASTGGMARECATAFRRIADILSDKKMPYSQVIHLIRCRLSLALIWSAIRAIRGSQRSRQPTVTDFNRAFTEAHLWLYSEFLYLHSIIFSSLFALTSVVCALYIFYFIRITTGSAHVCLV